MNSFHFIDRRKTQLALASLAWFANVGLLLSCPAFARSDENSAPPLQSNSLTYYNISCAEAHEIYNGRIEQTLDVESYIIGYLSAKNLERFSDGQAVIEYWASGQTYGPLDFAYRVSEICATQPNMTLVDAIEKFYSESTYLRVVE